MQFQSEITAAASQHGLDPRVVAGLVSVESNFNPYAWNPEPKFRYFWDVRTNKPFRAITPAEGASEFPPNDFPDLLGDRDQEWWAQQASWGLMQVMGAVAREHGFRGAYLTQLCEPSTVLEYGCMHLRQLMLWSGQDLDRALSAYNGGKFGNDTRPYRNQAYADRVKSAMANLRGAL